MRIMFTPQMTDLVVLPGRKVEALRSGFLHDGVFSGLQWSSGDLLIFRFPGGSRLQSMG